MSAAATPRVSHERQLVLLGVLAAFPLLPGTHDLLGNAAQAAVFTIVAASLVMLTGWVGQISLAHAAFVGIGAYATGWVAGGLGLGFPLSLPVAVAAAGLTAAGLGVVALRVRGLYLAVATLIFSWAASEYLFRQPWLLANSNVPPQTIGTPGTLLHLDLGSRRVHFYVAWAAAIALLFALANLRDSKTGRAFFAVRGSEMAAASLGMDVLRYKTLAFGLSGAIAGVAGNLMMTHARVVSPDTFDFNGSLFFLAIAVVGGLTSLAGAVAAALIFAGMAELFFRVAFLNQFLQLFSAVVLALIFRAYPGGLAALGESLARALDRATSAIRRLPVWAREYVAAATAPREDGPDADAPTKVSGPTVAPEVATRHSDSGAVDPEAPTIEIDTDSGDFDDASPAGRRSEGGQRLPLAVARATGRRMQRGVQAATRVVARLIAAVTRRPQRDDGHLDLDVTASVSAPVPPAASGGTDQAVALSTNGHGPDAAAGAPGGGVRIPTGANDDPVPDREAVARDERPALIAVDGITIRFGGLTAVDDASMAVRQGEITGLIGPNGAGKTTLFNTIAGYLTPDEGRVILHGHDVTTMPVHLRARLGVARTFQLIQLFSELTVFENLLAATHLQNATGFVQHMTVTPRALHEEARARARVKRVVELLKLDDVAHRQVAGLPFGALRMVEVARALVSGARVIMLDEPASGLDERETDNLMEVLRSVRDLGATLLLIEHDIRMVTQVTDYLYVLNQGRMIAEGPPAEIQKDPEVIAAYLGATAEPAVT